MVVEKVEGQTPKQTQVLIPKSQPKKRKHFCEPWRHWPMARQIGLLLGAFLILFIFVHIAFTVFIMEKYYVPDLKFHFKDEIESVHNYRTSNMTLAISYRI